MRELPSKIDPDELAMQRMDSESGGACTLQHEKQVARTRERKFDEQALARMAGDGHQPDLNQLIQTKYPLPYFWSYNINGGDLFLRRMLAAVQDL